MKKKLLIVAIAVCLIAVMACGSLAYFSAKDDITNQFLTANYDPDHPEEKPTDDEIFSITVKETVPGTSSTTTGSTNTYEDAIPGKTFAKDPTVENTGSYDEWVRVSVIFDKVKEWDAAGIKAENLFSTIVTKGYDSSKWDTEAVSVSKDGETAKFVFYYKNKLASKASVSLFSEVTVPTTLETEDMAALNGFTVKVCADAIQADNTGASAKATFTNEAYWKD